MATNVFPILHFVFITFFHSEKKCLDINEQDVKKCEWLIFRWFIPVVYVQQCLVEMQEDVLIHNKFFIALDQFTHNVQYTPQDFYSLVAILDLKMAPQKGSKHGYCCVSNPIKSLLCICLSSCISTRQCEWLLVESVGRDSSVGIANAYGLDGPRIESRWERDFPHLSRPALRPTQPPVQWVPGLSRG